MKVTVIVITYNHEHFIAQALDSVLMQETKFPFEVIVSEDCSTDATRDIIINFKDRYPSRIRLLLSERNLNTNHVLTRGIEAAQGDYIALLDGDDYWTSPHKLQKQVDFLDNQPECGTCFHNVKIIYEDKSRDPWNYNSATQKARSTIDDLWVRNFIATSSVVFRQTLISTLPHWFFDMPFGDWPLHILNAQHAKIGYLSEVMAEYRIHAGGVWSSLNAVQQLESMIDFYDRMNSKLEYRYNAQIVPVLANQCHLLAIEYEKMGELEKARFYARRRFELAPSDRWLAWGKLIRSLVKLHARGILRRSTRLFAAVKR